MLTYTMNDLHKTLKNISFLIYTTEGNFPKTLEWLIGSISTNIAHKDLSEKIDSYIDNGLFFLEKLPCGRYVKSYRINEVCQRTVNILENSIDHKILAVLKENPRILYIEFYRWLTTKHSNMISSIIDEFWHQFMTFSYEYKSWCMDNFGRFIHHIPTPDYEKNEISPKDVINDNIDFFKAYVESYPLDKGLLLYSLPLRLYIHENKSFEDVKAIIEELSKSSTDSYHKELKRNGLNITREEILDSLKKFGYLVLGRMEQHEFCKAIDALGTVIGVSDIKINNISNRKFNKASGLDLHTDTPLADVVAWYCITQDETVGESIFLDSTEILKLLSEEEIEILSTTYIKYPIYKGTSINNHPVLCTSDKTQNIYYTSWLKNDDYDSEQIKVLEKFEKLVSTLPHNEVRLKPGESLILDNKRMLHGRNDIPPTSLRYLYRVHVALK